MERHLSKRAWPATARPVASTMGATPMSMVMLMATLLAGVAQAQTTPAGRLLASNCFQCHGTNGKGPGFETLAGRPAKEIYEKLQSFASGKEGNGLMARHAMGYTDAQMQSLSAWLATQK